MKLVSLSTGNSGGGVLSADPLLRPNARSSSTERPLSLMTRRRLRVLWRGTLETGVAKKKKGFKRDSGRDIRFLVRS